MIKLTEKSRRILRSIYRGIGAAVVTLSVSACPWDFIPAPMYGPPDMYGMPPDTREDIRIHGQVKNKATSEPIAGIGVYMQNINYHTTTSFNGNFQFWVPKQNNPNSTYTLIFTDIDGDANGGKFKQQVIVLTQEQAEALKDNPLIIEMEEETDGE